MSTLSEFPDSVKKFVKVRKTETWVSPAHPGISIEYISHGPNEPAEVIDIRINASLMAEGTQHFLRRFSFDVSEMQAFYDELGEFLRGIQPSGERQPMRAGEF